MKRAVLLLSVLFGASALVPGGASASVSGAAPEAVPVRAELPRVFLDTTYVPATGASIPVHAGDDLQAALDAADAGDELVLDAGATFTGSFILPDKPGQATIVVRSSQLAALPAEGVRVGPEHAASMPRIQAPTNFGAITTAPGAHDWRFVGIELGVAPGVGNTGVLRLGNGDEATKADLPSDIVVDRCWLHGTATNAARRGVSLNGRRMAVIDSYLSDFHEVGADAQAIAGWNGPGPFKIVNNHLEGSGENVMFGGADSAVPNIVPSDIEIRGNHLFKPLSWRVGDPSYAGIHWSVKNLFELKSARRVLVEDNLMENNWGDAQTGFAINLKSANQDGDAPWSGTSDVTFRDNVVRHSGNAITIAGRDPHTEELTRRVTIEGNLFYDIDADAWKGSGIFLQVVSGPKPPGGTTQEGPANLLVAHNTVIHTGNILVADGGKSQRFGFTDNIVGHGRFGVKGSSKGEGIQTLEFFFPGYKFTRNLITDDDEDTAALYPPGSFFPATWADVGFVDFAGGDYRLDPASPYAGVGKGGTDPGADIGVVP